MSWAMLAGGADLSVFVSLPLVCDGAMASADRFRDSETELGRCWRLEAGSSRRAVCVDCSRELLLPTPSSTNTSSSAIWAAGDFDADCLAAAVDCSNGPDGKAGIPVRLAESAGWRIRTRHGHFTPARRVSSIPGRRTCCPELPHMIQTEFQRLPITAGTVTAQPSPHTLRGAETNFFAERRRSAVRRHNPGPGRPRHR